MRADARRVADGASRTPQPARRSTLRALGLGLITGAADDDPSAIGTYAAAGAKFGPAFLWTAPATLPMMFAVVYLSAKLGQVSGRGLFAAIRKHYPRWLLWTTLTGVLIGNTFEAGADIGGMSAALGLLVPVPFGWIVIGVSIAITALQIWGSYVLIRNLFRWLALALLAYVGAALLAAPDVGATLAATLVPHVRLDRDFLMMLVAVIGTSLSAYLYSWQSNEEVEEEIAMGRTSVRERRGATEAELRQSRRDILYGMVFSNIVMYFIILSTASTLFRAGHTDISTAADAAEALQPLAGRAAGVLFAVGVAGVGFLAVPVMIGGAAYDLSQSLGWRSTLHAKPSQAKKFYGTIAAFTAVAAAMNFAGLNPMKVLVWSAVVQGFSTPPLMLIIMLLTNSPAVMGERVNGRAINILGGLTTAAIFIASIALLVSTVRG